MATADRFWIFEWGGVGGRWGGMERDSEFFQHCLRRLDRVAPVRLEVGHLLHAGLDSLRCEQGLLFGGLQVVEHFPHAAAIPVETQGVAEP